ncbi:MAG: hypothetical protein AB4063_19655 [Crocosphaera sp.]
MNNETIYQANLSLVFRCHNEETSTKAQEIYESLLLEMGERLEDESEKHGFSFNFSYDDEPLEVINVPQ